jgi:hypothetical protein
MTALEKERCRKTRRRGRGVFRTGMMVGCLELYER